MPASRRGHGRRSALHRRYRFRRHPAGLDRPPGAAVPQQRFNHLELIAFSRRFGETDHAPVQENGQRFVPGLPEIYIVSNVIEGGVAIGSLGAGEAAWHSDMSYLAAPPQASMLYAVEIPPAGGDTSFCDMSAAFDALPDGLRARAAGRRVKRTEPTTAAATCVRA